MYPFYKKNELNFSLILIMAYVVSLSLADSLSASLGILKLSLIHISEPTRQAEISYAVFCLKKKKKENTK